MSTTYIHYLALFVWNQGEIAPRILADQDNISWSQYTPSAGQPQGSLAREREKEVSGGKVLILNPEQGRWSEEAISQTSPFKVCSSFVWPTFIIPSGKKVTNFR